MAAKAIVLAVSVLVGAAAFFGAHSAFDRSPRPEAELAAVEKGLAEAGLGGFLRMFKTNFPDEHREVITTLAEAKADGKSSAEVAAIAQEAVSKVRRRHADSIAGAGLPELDAMLAAQVKFARLLAEEDPRHCGAFLFQGPNPAMLAEVSKTKMQTLANLAYTTFSAIAAGRGKPKADDATGEDGMLLAEELQERGVGASEAAVAVGAGQQPAASPARICEIGLAVMSAMGSLKAASRRRVMASVFSTAAKE